MTLRLGNAIAFLKRSNAPSGGDLTGLTDFQLPTSRTGWPPRPRGAEPRDGAHRAFDELSAAPWAGRHYVAIGQDETVCLHVKFAAIQTLPRVGKQKRDSHQLLTLLSRFCASMANNQRRPFCSLK